MAEARRGLGRGMSALLSEMTPGHPDPRETEGAGQQTPIEFFL